jgi:uncharacterized protein YutE (UPF0331/DUF86 family)
MLHNIEKKIDNIYETINILEELKDNCEEKFLTDKIYKGALLHYLYEVSDSCISLAEMIIKYKNIPRATSYYDSIDILGEKGIIPPDFAYNFANIASFRNFLAHHYTHIDYKEICQKILGKLNDIKLYLSYIKEYINNSY